MKNGFIPCLLFVLIIFIICMIIFIGRVLDYEYNHKHSRKNDNQIEIKPRKTLEIKCRAFEAVEITFGRFDKLLFIHHLYDKKSNYPHWGDVTIIRYLHGYADIKEEKNYE